MGSFLAVARFAVARKGSGADVVVKLETMHRQAKQQARRQAKIDLGKKPAAWLDWPGVLGARVAAEKALQAYTGGDFAKKVRLTRDVLLLRLHSDQPPDRVGLVRTLRLGDTLRLGNDGGYNLVVSKPEAHKTVAVFGASNTQFNASTAVWIQQYIEIAAIPDRGYLFHAKDDTASPLESALWTRLVQRVYKKHAGVAICPKDLRASFISWLRSGEHGDEVLKAAAVAMRHDSQTAASATYDKEGTQRLVESAMKVAAAASAQYAA